MDMRKKELELELVNLCNGTDSGPPTCNTAKPQHLLRHRGLAAVQATQKYSHVAVTKPACLPTTSPLPANHLTVACQPPHRCLPTTSPSLFLYRRPWCIKSACSCYRHFYIEVPALVLTCRFLYTLFCVFSGPPLAFVRGVVAL